MPYLTARIERENTIMCIHRVCYNFFFRDCVCVRLTVAAVYRAEKI
jgi:hypothetical protein